jgi:1,4-dihydroxy-2-naphthoyl-CoA synthase
LNRPERLNAVNGQMHTELEALLAEISDDDGINAIILTGFLPEPDAPFVPAATSVAWMNGPARGVGASRYAAPNG